MPAYAKRSRDVPRSTSPDKPCVCVCLVGGERGVFVSALVVIVVFLHGHWRSAGYTVVNRWHVFALEMNWWFNHAQLPSSSHLHMSLGTGIHMFCTGFFQLYPFLFLPIHRIVQDPCSISIVYPWVHKKTHTPPAAKMSAGKEEITRKREKAL